MRHCAIGTTDLLNYGGGRGDVKEALGGSGIRYVDRIDRSISVQVGSLPYIRIPIPKILPAARRMNATAPINRAKESNIPRTVRAEEGKDLTALYAE